MAGKRSGMPDPKGMHGIHTISLRGQLTDDGLQAALRDVEPALEDHAHNALLVDALEMTGYEPDARALFVRWNAEHRTRIDRVAILTQRTLWRAVIAGMSLASKQQMRAFATRDEALAWLSPV